MNYKVKQSDVNGLLLDLRSISRRLVNQHDYSDMFSFLMYYSRKLKSDVPKDLVRPEKVIVVNDFEYLNNVDTLFLSLSFGYESDKESYKQCIVDFLARQYVTDVLVNKKRSETKVRKAIKEDIASRLDEQYKEFEETKEVVNILPTIVQDEINRRHEEARARKLENLQKRNRGGRKSVFTDIDEDTLIELFATKTDKEIEALDDINAKLSTIRGQRRKLALKYVVDKDEKLKQISQDLKEYKDDKELEKALKAERTEVKKSDNVAFDKRSKALITDTDEHLEAFIKQALSRRNVL